MEVKFMEIKIDEKYVRMTASRFDAEIEHAEPPRKIGKVNNTEIFIARGRPEEITGMKEFKIEEECCPYADRLGDVIKSLFEDFPDLKSYGKVVVIAEPEHISYETEKGFTRRTHRFVIKVQEVRVE